MGNTKSKWSIADVKTSYFVFFGATIGLVSYVNSGHFLNSHEN